MDLSTWSWKHSLATLVVMLGLSALGCATIFEGSEKDLSVESTPSEATVKHNGTDKGKTPTTLTLKKGDTHTIKISKSGYQTQTVRITNEINPLWVVIDIVAGGVPLIIDAITGAWYKLSEEKVNVSLKRGSSAGNGPGYRLEIEGGERIAGSGLPVHSAQPAPFRPATAD